MGKHRNYVKYQRSATDLNLVAPGCFLFYSRFSDHPPSHLGAPMTAFAYTANIQTTRVNNGAQLIARGGICTAPEGGNVRTIINFECNSAGQQQSLVNTAATDCEATFDFITHVACGGSASAKVTVSVNIGMILLLAFFIPLIVYFVVGTGYVVLLQLATSNDGFTSYPLPSNNCH